MSNEKIFRVGIHEHNTNKILFRDLATRNGVNVNEFSKCEIQVSHFIGLTENLTSYTNNIQISGVQNSFDNYLSVDMNKSYFIDSFLGTVKPVTGTPGLMSFDYMPSNEYWISVDLNTMNYFTFSTSFVDAGSCEFFCTLNFKFIK